MPAVVLVDTELEPVVSELDVVPDPPAPVMPPVPTDPVEEVEEVVAEVTVLLAAALLVVEDVVGDPPLSLEHAANNDPNAAANAILFIMYP